MTDPPVDPQAGVSPDADARSADAGTAERPAAPVAPPPQASGSDEAAADDGGSVSDGAAAETASEPPASGVSLSEASTTAAANDAPAAAAYPASAADVGPARVGLVAGPAAVDPGAARPAVDPFATVPIPRVPPAADRSPAETPSAGSSAADPQAAEPWARPLDLRKTGSAPFDLDDAHRADPLFDDEHTTHLHRAAEAPTLLDDEPTEAFPAVGPAGGGRHRAAVVDDPPETEWRPARPTSRVTTGLVVVLLVALGFLAGVVVGRSAAPHTPAGDTARPTATGTARPGALG